MELAEQGQRLDIWLYQARFFKTRALSKAFITKKGVRVTRLGTVRAISKPAATILPLDVLTFYYNQTIVHLKIEALGQRRGPASEARMLYSITDGTEEA